MRIACLFIISYFMFTSSIVFAKAFRMPPPDSTVARVIDAPEEYMKHFMAAQNALHNKQYTTAFDEAQLAEEWLEQLDMERQSDLFRLKAEIYSAQNLYREASAYYEQALNKAYAAKRYLVEKDTTDVGYLKLMLANNYSARNLSSNALPLYEELENNKELSPNPVQQYLFHSGYGVALTRAHQFKQAEYHLFKALELAQDRDNARVATMESNIGWMFLEEDKLDKAEVYLNKALAWRENNLPDNYKLFLTVDNLAHVYMKKEKYDKAEELLERALAGYEKTLPENHFAIGAGNSALCRTHFYQQEYEEAKPYCDKAMAILRSQYDEDHFYIKQLQEVIPKVDKALEQAVLAK